MIKTFSNTGSFQSINNIYVPIAMMLLPFIKYEPAPVDIFMLIFFMFVLTRNLIYTKYISQAFVYFIFVTISFIYVLFYQGDLSENASSYTRHTLIEYFMILLFVIFASISNHKLFDIDNLFKWFVYGALVSSIIVLFFYAIGSQLVMREYGLRLSGFTKDPNVYALYLTAAIIFSLHSYFSSKSKTLFTLFSIGIFAVSLFLSGSRGGLLSCIIALFFYLIFFPRSNNKLSILIALLIGCFGVYIYWLLNPESFLISRLGIQDYDTNRFNAFAEYGNLILENPLGKGAAYAAEELYSLSFIENRNTAHNIFINKAINFGIFSSLILLLLILRATFTSLRLGLKNNNQSLLLLAIVLMTTLINSMTIDSSHWRHYIVLLAVAHGIINSKISHDTQK